MKCILIVVIFLNFFYSCFSQITGQPDTSIIKSSIARYAESINNADTAIGSLLFAHSPEVSFINPRGHLHGWSEIKSQIYEFFGETFSQRKLEIYNQHVNIYNNMAWVEFYWTFDATMKKSNFHMQTKGRESQVWVKSGNEWRLVHVHYSAMPVTGTGQGF